MPNAVNATTGWWSSIATTKENTMVRVCGATCHKARRAKCRCWCGGLFHGSQGGAARTAFADDFGTPPRDERTGERWDRALTRAREAVPRAPLGT